ncbi:MAG TPA: redoxin domain-containing protein [Candidatus Hydrogenedentes bacterium]|nr:redoxin domain-containing protein [Candidatus Hydrogenedentota bacterium]
MKSANEHVRGVAGAIAPALCVAALLFSIVIGPACSKPAGNAPQAAVASDSVTVVRSGEVEAMLRGARGKVVVVNLWATWCKPCVEEMPYLARFYREYRPKDVAFFALSVDASDDVAAVRRFHKEQDLPFPVHIVDERDPDALGKAIQTELSGAVPVTIFYDRSGAPRHVREGAIDYAELTRQADALL